MDGRALQLVTVDAVVVLQDDRDMRWRAICGVVAMSSAARAALRVRSRSGVVGIRERPFDRALRGGRGSVAVEAVTSSAD
jgi:hypothetical protein